MTTFTEKLKEAAEPFGGYFIDGAKWARLETLKELVYFLKYFQPTNMAAVSMINDNIAQLEAENKEKENG